MRALLSSAVPLGAALAILLPACQPDAPIPDERSTYVDLYLNDGIEVCEGQLEAYDRFVERSFPFYAGEPATGFRIDVHVLADPDCREGGSCARDGAVWLKDDYAQYHELVHGIQMHVDGRSMPSLEEGTAEALGPGAPISYSALDLEGLDPGFLFAASYDDVDYPRSGAFTRFAIERWGTERFRELFRALGQIDDAGEDDYRREFEAAFGEALDDVWPVFLSAPRCAYNLAHCDQPEPIELPFELDGIDCRDPETLGYDGSALDLPPTQVPYQPARILRLTSTGPRTVTFELEHILVYLGGCGDCSAQPPALFFSSSDVPGFPPTRADLELQAGTTILFVRPRSGGTPRMWITEGV